MSAHLDLKQRFFALTPGLVVDAVEVGGRRCTGRFVELNSYENRVYELEVEDGPAVVGKFYRPGRWSLEALDDEHDFLADLDEAGVPVALPLELDDGHTIGTLGGEAAGIHFSIFEKVLGRIPDELTDARLRVIGRLLAQLHDVGETEDAPARLRLDVDTYGRANLRYLLDHEHIPNNLRANFEATCDALFLRIEPHLAEVPVHRIHGDCHRANLLWTVEGPVFLDFDDMVVGPAVQDVWMLVPSADEEGDRQRRVLVEGYTEVRDFDPEWFRLVEPLRALRFLNYATWIAKRRDDPTFKRTFGHAGTERYWQQELMDLREQIARIDQR